MSSKDRVDAMGILILALIGREKCPPFNARGPVMLATLIFARIKCLNRLIPSLEVGDENRRC